MQSSLGTGGGPERLRILLEGESLLNDASSITLFTIFIEFVIEAAEGHPNHQGAGAIIATIIKKMLWLAVGDPGLHAALVNIWHPCFDLLGTCFC